LVPEPTGPRTNEHGSGLSGKERLSFFYGKTALKHDTNPITDTEDVIVRKDALDNLHSIHAHAIATALVPGDQTEGGSVDASVATGHLVTGELQGGV
jgi:hypothetical protein